MAAMRQHNARALIIISWANLLDACVNLLRFIRLVMNAAIASASKGARSGKLETWPLPRADGESELQLPTSNANLNTLA